MSLRLIAKELRALETMPRRPILVATVLLSAAAASGCAILVGILLKRILGATSGDDGMALHVAEAIAIVAVFALSSAMRVYSATILGNEIGSALRKAVFARLLGQPIQFFEETGMGRLTSVLMSDVNVVQTMFRSAITPLVRNGLTAAGAVMMMLATDASLFALVLCAIPIPMGLAIVFQRKNRGASKDAHRGLEDLAGRSAEVLSAYGTVMAFNAQAHEAERFSGSIDQLDRALRGIARRRAILLFVLTAWGGLAVIGVLLWGRHQVSTGQISAAGLSSFFYFLALGAISAASLEGLWNGVIEAMAALERIASVLRLPGAALRPAPVPSRVPLKSGIRFDDVHFHYPERGDAPVLRGVSFDVPVGGIVAVVGASGAGKSTLLRLLMGHERSVRGVIRIDGADTAELDPAELRAMMAVVPQEPFIFTGTIAENVSFGDPQASPDRIVTTAAQAALDGAAFPHGLETLVGDRGAMLSGGQRQRIAIARAILRGASIMVLDEATSALDGETEERISAVLSGLAATRCILIVAHRLSTLKIASAIVYLRKGRVEAIGSHAGLLARCPSYERFIQSQIVDR